MIQIPYHFNLSLTLPQAFSPHLFSLNHPQSPSFTLFEGHPPHDPQLPPLRHPSPPATVPS